MGYATTRTTIWPRLKMLSSAMVGPGGQIYIKNLPLVLNRSRLVQQWLLVILVEICHLDSLKNPSLCRWLQDHSAISTEKIQTNARNPSSKHRLLAGALQVPFNQYFGPHR